MKKLIFLFAFALTAQLGLAQPPIISTDSVHADFGSVTLFGRTQNIPAGFGTPQYGFTFIALGDTTFVVGTVAPNGKVTATTCLTPGSIAVFRTTVRFPLAGELNAPTQLPAMATGNVAPGEMPEAVFQTSQPGNLVEVCNYSLQNVTLGTVGLFTSGPDTVTTLTLNITGNLGSKLSNIQLLNMAGNNIASSLVGPSAIQVYPYQNLGIVNGVSFYTLVADIADTTAYGTITGTSFQVFRDSVYTNTSWNCNSESVAVDVVYCGAAPTATLVAPVGAHYVGDSLTYVFVATGFTDTISTSFQGFSLGNVWDRYSCPGTYRDSVILLGPLGYDTVRTQVTVLARYELGTPVALLVEGTVPVTTPTTPVGTLSVSVGNQVVVLDPSDFALVGGVWTAYATFTGLNPGGSYVAVLDYEPTPGNSISDCANPGILSRNFTTLLCQNMTPVVSINVNQAAGTFTVTLSGIAQMSGVVFQYDLQVYLDATQLLQVNGVDTAVGGSIILYSGPLGMNNAGDYVFSVNVSNFFCPGMVSDNVLINVTGVQNILSTSVVKVFPNPAYNQLNVQLSDPSLQMESVQLIDLSGRTILVQSAVLGSVNSISVSDVPAGVYLVHILTDMGFVTQRVVINH
jgi:hypothetical protein